MKYVLVFTLLWVVSPFLVSTAEAQLSELQTNASALVVSPRYPEPNTTVQLELNDYGLNTQGARYQWYINGVERVEAANQRSLSLPVGNLGETTTVLVKTILAGGAVVEARTTITPIRVDMLIEADTLVPTFYAGRALPSSGSAIRVTALPFLGTSQNPSTFSYTWRVGDEIVGGSSLYGKNSVTFSSGFERRVEVSVDIIDQSGTLVAKKTILVPISDPELHFYEVNPLQGLMERALGRNFIFSGDEINVRAEPYYMDRTFMAKQPFIEWKLNGQTITNPSQDPQEIVLRKSGDHGSFTIQFHVRNLRQLLQGVKDSVTITF